MSEPQSTFVSDFSLNFALTDTTSKGPMMRSPALLKSAENGQKLPANGITKALQTMMQLQSKCIHILQLQLQKKETQPFGLRQSHGRRRGGHSPTVSRKQQIRLGLETTG